jgi:uncharacterized Ntn-hydrolase superfamily protein
LSGDLEDWLVTFSIAARCPQTRMFGVAIVSSSPAVAARCAHARAAVGAVATQNITDPALGPKILERLGNGALAPVALEQTLRATPFAAYRQVIAIGSHGPAAIHSGDKALGIVATALGGDCAAAGNLLDNAQVPAAMVAAFQASSGHFGHRLLQALEAGAAQGGEAGPLHSAGLLVVREVSWPIVDLRIDWHDNPVYALGNLWDVYEPQIEDYVRRALDPAAAPTFGVPGDL